MKPKKVLIADDDHHLVSALTLRCQHLGLEVDSSPDGLHAWLNLIMPSPPDVVILDINMPFTNGLRVCKKIADDETLSGIPVIILTGETDPATIEQCRRMGAHYVLKGADTWERLEPLICQVLGLPFHPPKRVTAPTIDQKQEDEPAPKRNGAATVLVIDDDPAISKALRIELRQYGVDVVRAFSGEQGFFMALRELPDVIISDYSMPDGQGDYVLRRLQDHPLTKPIPVIILTGKTLYGQKDCGLARQMANLGAVEFLTKPPDTRVLFDVLRRYIPLRKGPSPVESAQSSQLGFPSLPTTNDVSHDERLQTAQDPDRGIPWG
ncbi:MAG: response regulator [Planctomycetes bacterium]|nr:response regulator [Planctomycetota bacterium]